MKNEKHIQTSQYFSEMRDENNIAEFDDLHTYFFTDAGTVKAVHGVTFDIPKNSVVGVVGESGCGKSVTALSMMRLLQAPQGMICGGSIRLNLGHSSGYDENQKAVYDIANMPIDKMREIRGKNISMIFQEPMTSLNPVFRIGNQMDEVILCHMPEVTKDEVKKRNLDMLRLVGIAMPERVYRAYPHELSGGMRQRIVIAMALSCNPNLIIADEPTTALDVTIQAQILELLRDIKDKSGASIMLITHDLGVIAEMADFVVVMYAGRVVEKGTVLEIFEDPRHPYTIGLQKSRPAINRTERLYSIPGQVPSPINLPQCCYFKNRCERASDKCMHGHPPMVQITPTHAVACHLCNMAKQI